MANPTLHPEFAGTVATIDTKAYDYGTDASPSSEGYHWNWNAESYFNIGEKMGQAMMNLLIAQSFMMYPHGCKNATLLNGKWNAIIDFYGRGDAMKGSSALKTT